MQEGIQCVWLIQDHKLRHFPGLSWLGLYKGRRGCRGKGDGHWKQWWRVLVTWWHWFWREGRCRNQRILAALTSSFLAESLHNTTITMFVHKGTVVLNRMTTLIKDTSELFPSQKYKHVGAQLQSLQNYRNEFLFKSLNLQKSVLMV